MQKWQEHLYNFYNTMDHHKSYLRLDITSKMANEQQYYICSKNQYFRIQQTTKKTTNIHDHDISTERHKLTMTTTARTLIDHEKLCWTSDDQINNYWAKPYPDHKVHKTSTDKDKYVIEPYLKSTSQIIFIVKFLMVSIQFFF